MGVLYSAAMVDLRLSNSTVLEGLEILALLKKHQKGCRIIVLTAYGEEDVRKSTIEAGADLFLEKPVDPLLIRKELEALGCSKPKKSS